jgi:hypothetical protein
VGKKSSYNQIQKDYDEMCTSVNGKEGTRAEVLTHPALVWNPLFEITRHWISSPPPHLQGRSIFDEKIILNESDKNGRKKC